MSRTATCDRNTKETQIHIELNIDGTGQYNIDTGVGFFDHMLEGFARHGLFDLTVKVKGDTQVDAHHTVEDTGIDHRLPLYLQHEALFIGHKLCGNREIGLHILHSQDRLSGSHLSYNGHIHHFPTNQVKVIIDDLDGAGLGGVSTDITVLLQGFQMRVDRRGGLQIHRFADIPD